MGAPLTTAEIVAMRLRAQGLLEPSASSPEEVVSRLGALQAQDFLGSLWAMGVRLREVDEPAIERAQAQKAIVRSWPLRGTLHFVAGADLRWMLQLLGERTIARAAGRFVQVGLTAADFAKARKALSRALRDVELLPRPAAMQVLADAGVDPSGQRGLHIVWRLAHEGFICLGPRVGRQPSVVLLDRWLPTAPALKRDEALARLARRYFAGHGPATVHDFAWWAGMPIGEARAAIEIIGRELQRAPWGKHVLYFNADRLGAAPGGSALLLPAFDELLVAYVDRSALLDEEHRSRVNGGGGLLNPIAFIDGRVQGTWKRTLGRKGVSVRLSKFEGIWRKRDSAALEAAAQRYASFLRLPLERFAPGID